MASGVVGAIGLGVNEWQICEEALAHGDFDVILLAGRYTLLEQSALETFLPLCERRGVSIVLGGPYNSGILAGKATYNYAEAPPHNVEHVRKLQEVCARHDVPLSSAALQFVLAHPVVVSVIPGSQSVAEHEQNVAALNRALPDAFWAELQQRSLIRPEAPTPSQQTARC